MKTTTSEFYCVKCGEKGIPITRVDGRQREAGHLKKLYCLHCKEEVNHAEIRPFGSYDVEDFKKEFEMGRFVTGERVEINDLWKCTKSDCKYNINGKCWNASNSEKCNFKKEI